MARKMKDSGIEWIGEIPEGWEVIKAKYGIEVTHGCDPKTEGSIPVYGSGTESFKSCGEYKEGPAVLVGRKGTLTIPHYINGKYWNVDTAFDIKTKSNFHLRYYYYLATIFDYQFYISRTTLPSMTQGNYYNMFLPFPLLSEQQELASYLDTECSCIDALLTKARASIEEYKKLKQAVITQAVTKGVRGEREMKPTGFTRWSEIPFDWDLKRVKSCVASISSGLSAVTDDANSEESGKFVLRTSAVSSGFFVPTEVKPVLKSAVNRLICPVEPDTLIVSRMNTASMVGACAYVANNHPNTFLPDKLWKIKFLLSYYTKYMWYALNSVPAKSWFSELATGASSSMQNISINDFTSNYLPIPAFSEQKEIADYLDAKCAEIDGLIAKKEQLVKELESYKKSLIYEVVTGKREV